MLTYFPMPYPEELWYSVLCRYHVRSGNSKYSATMRELFGRPNASLSIFFANANFLNIFSRMPSGLLSKDDVLNQHTLTPYILFFADAKRREEALQFLAHGYGQESYAGTIKTWMPPKTYFRYCPICTQEDIALYGEPYWHTPHQIQLMPLCPKHGCYLENSSAEVTKMTRQQFTNANRRNCPDMEPRFNPFDQKSAALTQMLYHFWKEPAPKPETLSVFRKRLFLFLQNEGYFSVTASNIEPKLLEKQLKKYWSGLPYTIPNSAVFKNRLYKMTRIGGFYSPELYALLLVFLNLPPFCVNNPTLIPDRTGQLMQRLADSGYIWSKKRVAELLGVGVHGLSVAAQLREIPVFWETVERKNGNTDIKTTKEKQVSIKGYFPPEEKMKIDRHAHALGMENVSEYVRYCIRKDMASWSVESEK